MKQFYRYFHHILYKHIVKLKNNYVILATTDRINYAIHDKDSK